MTDLPVSLLKANHMNIDAINNLLWMQYEPDFSRSAIAEDGAIIQLRLASWGTRLLPLIFLALIPVLYSGGAPLRESQFIDILGVILLLACFVLVSAAMASECLIKFDRYGTITRRQRMLGTEFVTEIKRQEIQCLDCVPLYRRSGALPRLVLRVKTSQRGNIRLCNFARGTHFEPNSLEKSDLLIPAAVLAKILKGFDYELSENLRALADAALSDSKN